MLLLVLGAILLLLTQGVNITGVALMFMDYPIGMSIQIIGTTISGIAIVLIVIGVKKYTQKFSKKMDVIKHLQI